MAEKGLSGAGAGMFDRLFGAGLNLGTQFGLSKLGGGSGSEGFKPPQVNVQHDITSSLLDQKTILIGVALIAGAIVVALMVKGR